MLATGVTVRNCWRKQPFPRILWQTRRRSSCDWLNQIVRFIFSDRRTLNVNVLRRFNFIQSKLFSPNWIALLADDG